MTDLVVWAGPVASFQVKGATIPGAKELFIGCHGNRPPHCPTIGDQLSYSPELLLAKAHMDPANLGQLFMGAFSAGGSTLKRLLSNKAYRDITTSVHLADATYTSHWIDQKNRIPPAIEGFVRYAVDVVEGPGDKLLVATASPNPNKQWATGIENIRAIRDEVEGRTGKQFVNRPDFFGIEPGPTEVWQLGNVFLAPFPGSPLGHNHPKIAGQVWQKIIHPWLDKGKGLVDEPGGLKQEPGNGPVEPPEQRPWAFPDIGAGGVVAMLGAAVAGYLAAREVMKRAL